PARGKEKRGGVSPSPLVSVPLEVRHQLRDLAEGELPNLDEELEDGSLGRGGDVDLGPNPGLVLEDVLLVLDLDQVEDLRRLFMSFLIENGTRLELEEEGGEVVSHCDSLLVGVLLTSLLYHTV